MASRGNQRLISELRRRRVLPVAGAYLAIAWGVTEIAGFLLEQIGAPAWALRMLAIAFVVGFPVAVALAWIVQRRPGAGWTLDSSKGQSLLVMATVVLGLLLTVGLAWVILPRIDDQPPDVGYRPLPNTLAILPFKTPHDMPAEALIGRTLEAALTTGLTRSDEVDPIQLRLSQQPAGILELGRQVRAAYLLTGGLRSASGGIRIELELLDVTRESVAWSRQFSWDPTRIMELTTELGNEILGAMGLSSLTHSRFVGTDDLEAYEAFLLGIAHRSSQQVDALDAAALELERAIVFDPDFALAHVELARTLQILESRQGSASEKELQTSRDRIRQLASLALELDEYSADAWSVMGSIADNDKLAAEFYRRAIEIDPTHAVSYFRLALLQDDLIESQRLLHKALDYDPMDANCRFELAKILWLGGSDEEAITETERAMEFEPGDPQAYYILGMRYKWGRGRLDEAIAQYRKGYAIDPNTAFSGVIAREYANLGARDEAFAWLKRVQEDNPTIAYGWTTWVEYLVGDRSLARQAAEKLYQMHIREMWGLSALSRLDIQTGQAATAVARWDQAFPEFRAIADEDLCSRQDVYAVDYAQALKAAGETDRAKAILEPCLEYDLSRYRLTVGYRFQTWVNALLERRKETLEGLRWLVFEGHYRVGSFLDFRLEGEEFAFLQDDPEFQNIRKFIENEISAQRQRIRELERSGLLPSPDVRKDDSPLEDTP